MITYFIVLSMIFITHAQTSPSPCPPPKKKFCPLVWHLVHLVSCKKFQVWVCVKILHLDWSKHIMWFCDWLAVPSSSLCLLCLFLYQTAIPLIRNINKKNAATAPMVPPMTAPILLPGPKSKKWHEITS